jgi:hypothetical protein
MSETSENFKVGLIIILAITCGFLAYAAITCNGEQLQSINYLRERVTRAENALHDIRHEQSVRHLKELQPRG